MKISSSVNVERDVGIQKIRYLLLRLELGIELWLELEILLWLELGIQLWLELEIELWLENRIVGIVNGYVQYYKDTSS